MHTPTHDQGNILDFIINKIGSLIFLKICLISVNHLTCISIYNVYDFFSDHDNSAICIFIVSIIIKLTYRFIHDTFNNSRYIFRFSIKCIRFLVFNSSSLIIDIYLIHKLYNPQKIPLE